MEPTQDQRTAWAKAGYAMPDGSYYVRPGNKQDLLNAIDAVGRGGGGDSGHNAIRRHIMTRANAQDMNCASMIPDTWGPDGSLKHFDVDDFIAHFGVKGMHWGQRHGSVSGSGSAKTPMKSSADHNRSAQIKAKVAQNKGIHSLTNKELQDVVTRMNLEQQYSRLETGPGSKADKGRKFVNQVTTDGRSGINLYKTAKEVSKILGPILLAAGAAAAANKAGGNVQYYHPSSRKALTAS